MAKAENNRIRLPRFLSFPVISRWISPLASPAGFPRRFSLAASPAGLHRRFPGGFTRWLSPLAFPDGFLGTGFPVEPAGG